MVLETEVLPRISVKDGLGVWQDVMISYDTFLRTVCILLHAVAKIVCCIFIYNVPDDFVTEDPTGVVKINHFERLDSLHAV